MKSFVFGFMYRGNGYGFWDTYEEASHALRVMRQREIDERFFNALGVVHRFEVVHE